MPAWADRGCGTPSQQPRPARSLPRCATPPSSRPRPQPTRGLQAPLPPQPGQRHPRHPARAASPPARHPPPALRPRGPLPRPRSSSAPQRLPAGAAADQRAGARSCLGAPPPRRGEVAGQAPMRAGTPEARGRNCSRKRRPRLRQRLVQAAGRGVGDQKAGHRKQVGGERRSCANASLPARSSCVNAALPARGPPQPTHPRIHVLTPSLPP